MQLQSLSWQILNLESYSLCPLIFLTLNWDCQVTHKKRLWEKHFLCPVNDKCFFLRKWSHFFLAFVYFQCLVSFTLVYCDHPWKAGLSVFHSLVVLFAGAAAVICFLSEKIYRHISLLDRHNEPPGSPKEKLPHARAVPASPSHPPPSTLKHHHDSEANPNHFCLWTLPWILGLILWFPVTA